MNLFSCSTSSQIHSDKRHNLINSKHSSNTQSTTSFALVSLIPCSKHLPPLDFSLSFSTGAPALYIAYPVSLAEDASFPHSPNTPLCECITLHSKQDFPDIITLGILRWEIILDYLGVWYNRKGNYKREAEGPNQRMRCDDTNRDRRSDDVMLLTLTLERGTRGQGGQENSKI